MADESYAAYEAVPMPSVQDDGFQVPVIVEVCVGWMMAKGLTEEGVFRIPASKPKIEGLLHEFRNGLSPWVSRLKLNFVSCWMVRLMDVGLPPFLLTRILFCRTLPGRDNLDDVYDAHEVAGLIKLWFALFFFPVPSFVVAGACIAHQNEPPPTL